ncbi:MAG: ABC transporter ATP-binding protein [Faecousia sp.]
MITVQHLTKYYGDHLAVDDISFEIDEGHVYGFLGPNGAGKSTTMNIMTGCLSATAGTVQIDGHDIFEEPNAAKRCIGYLPEHPPLYMNESALEYLKFVAEAKGLRGAQRDEQIRRVIGQTGIADVQHRRISALSKGYRQRVGIAQALLGSPKVIILDEPTVGLDPIQIIEIRDLIKSLGKTHTVIFSSHILSEVQAICDRIVMIAGGKLVALGVPEELQRQLLTAGEIILTTDAPVSQVKQALSELEHITGLEFVQGEAGMTVAHIQTGSGDMNRVSRSVAQCFARKGLAIYEMAQKKGSLEDVFLELSESKEQEADQS